MAELNLGDRAINAMKDIAVFKTAPEKINEAIKQTNKTVTEAAKTITNPKQLQYGSKPDTNAPGTNTPIVPNIAAVRGYLQYLEAGGTNSYDQFMADAEKLRAEFEDGTEDGPSFYTQYDASLGEKANNNSMKESMAIKRQREKVQVSHDAIRSKKLKGSNVDPTMKDSDINQGGK